MDNLCNRLVFPLKLRYLEIETMEAVLMETFFNICVTGWVLAVLLVIIISLFEDRLGTKAEERLVCALGGMVIASTLFSLTYVLFFIWS